MQIYQEMPESHYPILGAEIAEISLSLYIYNIFRETENNYDEKNTYLNILYM